MPYLALWRFAPHALIFFSSACIMIVELTAGRLIARHLGNSLYSWTSVIGVVLAGMSLGNYVGGRMSDRWKPEAFLGWLFMGASAACALTLLLNQFLAEHQVLEGLAWPRRVFLSVLIVFLAPALVLGAISPAAAKLALLRNPNLGAAIGAVYAWGALGSIAGTLGAGFWLIAALGVSGVVLFVSLGLALAGLCLGPRRALHALWVAVVLVALFLSRTSASAAQALGVTLGLRSPPGLLFAADSDYQRVQVAARPSPRDPRRTLRVLETDLLEQGWLDASDPDFMEFDFERVCRDVARRSARGKSSVATFVIGGGPYSFARWVGRQWPGSPVDVAEIDPLVLEANFAALGLPRDTSIRTFCLDARHALDRLPAEARYDLIFGDAYSAFSMPFHLTTVEFARKLKARLAPGGVYLVNVIDDIEYGQLLGSFICTLRAVFPHVLVFAAHRDGPQPGLDNYILAASERPLDVSDWLPGHRGAFPGSLVSGARLEELQRKCGGRILTDDNAPVENLLAPALSKRR